MPLHALLASKSGITHNLATSTFPECMVAAVQTFSQGMECWVAQEFPTLRERSRAMSVLSWATSRAA